MPELTALDVRPFDRARDFPAVAELINTVNAHDDFNWRPGADELAREWALAETSDAERDAILVEARNRLAAAGAVSWVERDGKIIHDIEIWVDPRERRRGLGRQILAWLEDRAHASVAAGTGGDPSLPHVLGGGYITANVAAAAFAARAGYPIIRYGFQMRRPLDREIPELPMPEGLEVRPVLPEHHRAIWDADVEAFLDHWEARVRTEQDYVRTFTDPHIDVRLWQVAWAGDEVAGIVMNNIYPDENEKIGLRMGWLDHVSVRRPWRGRGLASALIVRSLRVHRDRGMEVAALGVDAENPTGALHLYEKFGFRPRYTWAIVRKPF
ncbi:MAG TPA: GNAT family N-acetyltransferase [Candidatus Dormibacteraeota bacterium]|nr:GNAT family N-acetyltransferase [Candidatus Dormibacteraeota bacterium]